MKKHKTILENGKAVAAIVAAGIGSFVGLFTFVAKRRRRSAKQDDNKSNSKKSVKKDVNDDVQRDVKKDVNEGVKNGKAMGAILSAGIGSFILGIFIFTAMLAEAAEEFLTFYQPSGSLSGVTTLAVIGWLISWLVFYFAWRKHDVNFYGVFIIALILIGLGLLFMFPPFIGVFSG